MGVILQRSAWVEHLNEVRRPLEFSGEIILAKGDVNRPTLEVLFSYPYGSSVWEVSASARDLVHDKVPSVCFEIISSEHSCIVNAKRESWRARICLWLLVMRHVEGLCGWCGQIFTVQPHGESWSWLEKLTSVSDSWSRCWLVSRLPRKSLSNNNLVLKEWEKNF